ncbi:MAG: hypothetical protein MJA31_10635 [Clostridia bacterium]|nr:hypothetical protein [Clostridia bacterium]
MHYKNEKYKKWKKISEKGILKYVIYTSIPIAIAFILFIIYFSLKTPENLYKLIIYNSSIFFIIICSLAWYWFDINKKYKHIINDDDNNDHP